MLRYHCQRALRSYDLWHQDRVTALALVLTGRDISLPWMHDNHPWRWGEPGSGVFGTAIESCRRSLGLTGPVGDPEVGDCTLRWGTSVNDGRSIQAARSGP